MNTTERERAQAGKYLTFTLANESFGIEVMKVREIIRLTHLTVVPQMPDYVRGVMNLRGRVIPVLDLRLRFGLARGEATEKTCIVVVLVNLPGGVRAQIGLVVDGVEEVIHVSEDDIEETPDFGRDISTECVIGMAKVKGIVKSLLDIDRVFFGDGARQLEPVERN